jgi:hypothetical protein
VWGAASMQTSKVWIGAVPVFNEDNSIARSLLLALQLHHDWRQLVLNRDRSSLVSPADLDDAPDGLTACLRVLARQKVAPRHTRQPLCRDCLRVAAVAAARF